MNGPLVAGHQPNFFPWFGYFEKMLLADVFVFSDDVRFTKQNYVNRVEIPIGSGASTHNWVLPVLKGNDQRIADKRYLKDDKTLVKLLRTAHVNLGGLPYFSDVAGVLMEFKNAFWQFDTVADLNIYMNTSIARRLGIRTPTRRGTDLGLHQWHGTERLLRRLEILGSDTYLSGAGASEYTDESMFAERNLTLRVITYHLGPQLLGESARYSILVGVGLLGFDHLSSRIACFDAGQAT